MSLELLLAQWDAVIQTPDDVAKLNALILQWAVQGKLVPQCAEDEPIVFALKSAEVEREKLENDGLVRKRAPIQPLDKVEPPFSIPTNWAFCRLGACIELINGRAYKQSELLDSGTPIIRIQNLNGGERWYYSDLDLPEDKYCDAGDLLFAWSATFGPYIWEGDKAIYHYHIWKIQLTQAIEKKFAYYLLQFLTDQAKAQSHGLAMLHITKAKMENLPIVLPPLEEQKRIVAKVDELFEQTRLLAEQMAQAQAQQRRVHQAVVHQLAAAAAPITPAWQIIARQFDTLYQHPDHIAELKQTILQLAVQGRLVPQDEKDEDAAALLERIAGTKDFLLSNDKNNLVVDKLPSLPKSWSWIRLETLLEGIKAGKSPQAQKYPAKDNEFGVLKVSAVTWGKFQPNENKALFPGASIDGMPTVKENDLLISRANTAELVGAVVLVEKDYPNLLLSDKTLRLDFMPGSVHKPFILLALRASWVRAIFEESAIGTSSSMRNISQEKMRSAPIALPPFEEQKRIAIKVDELFALCDQLTTHTHTAEAIRLRLRDALLTG